MCKKHPNTTGEICETAIRLYEKKESRDRGLGLALFGDRSVIVRKRGLVGQM
jgi:hypothetical protein